MKLYLVRHGEAESNVSEKVSEKSDATLTEKGRKQAEFMGRRFLSLPIDAIVSSTFARAKETAEIVASILDKEIIFSDLPVECRRPSDIFGMERSNPKIKKIYAEIKNSMHIPGWRYSDEENFEDLVERAEKTLAYILSLKRESVLLVTHGRFMRVLLAYMVFGKSLTPLDLWRFLYEAFEIKNTGLTICSHREEEMVGDHPGWRIITWNDHAHLGDA